MITVFMLFIVFFFIWWWIYKIAVVYRLNQFAAYAAFITKLEINTRIFRGAEKLPSSKI